MAGRRSGWHRVIPVAMLIRREGIGPASGFRQSARCGTAVTARRAPRRWGRRGSAKRRPHGAIGVQWLRRRFCSDPGDGGAKGGNLAHLGACGRPCREIPGSGSVAAPSSTVGWAPLGEGPERQSGRRLLQVEAAFVVVDLQAQGASRLAPQPHEMAPGTRTMHGSTQRSGLAEDRA